MPTKPDLIIFSQYLLGGGTSFHKNMLAHFPNDYFEIKCIYIDPINWHGAKALDIKLNDNDIILPLGNESEKEIARKISLLIPNTEGVIISNLANELMSLDLYPKSKKTVFFVCHDDGFLNLAFEFQSIIDVFIAHNYSVYEALHKGLDNRKEDVYFIQHGVTIPNITRAINVSQKLKIVFLARHHTFKGLYDLPIIDDIIIDRGINVEWMILGDGPERENFIKQTENRPNFQFEIPQTNEEVLNILQKQDVFILPSRADGLPVALLESMSVGCVPIVSNFSEGIKKVITNNIGFVVSVGDNNEFADRIIELSKDRKMLEQLSKNCIEKAKREFDIRNQAKEYYDLYKRYPNLKKSRKLTLKDFKRRLIKYSDTFVKINYFFDRLKTKIIK